MIQSLFNHRKFGCYGDSFLIRYTLKDETVCQLKFGPLYSAAVNPVATEIVKNDTNTVYNVLYIALLR